MNMNAVLTALIFFSCVAPRPEYHHMTMGHSYAVGADRSGAIANITGCEQIPPVAEAGWTIAALGNADSEGWLTRIRDTDNIVIHLTVGGIDEYFWGHPPQTVANMIKILINVIWQINPGAVIIQTDMQGICGGNNTDDIEFYDLIDIEDPRYEFVRVPPGHTFDGCHPSNQGWSERFEFLFQESRLFSATWCD